MMMMMMMKRLLGRMGQTSGEKGGTALRRRNCLGRLEPTLLSPREITVVRELALLEAEVLAANRRRKGPELGE